tara:strand:+ start:97990 stop:98307 length:318 start_codon:yes stop_codon:yes gene_type:complete
MKRFFSIFTISTFLLLTACSGCNGEAEHSHGEDGDHTHEQPAAQSSGDDKEPVRIGSTKQDSTHTHDDDSDHNHGEDSDHSHDEDDDHDHGEDTHSHGDEDHSHN